MRSNWLKQIQKSSTKVESNVTKLNVPTVHFKVSAHSSRGSRNEKNEDAYLVSSKEGLFAVADGMGGHNAGSLASRIAIDTLFDSLIASKAKITKVRILQAIQQANQKIITKAAQEHALQGMGCTLVIAWINNNILNCFNVGDSRAYLWRNFLLQQITHDQTIDSSNKSALSQAMGGTRNIKADEYEIKLNENDAVLLTTDGITDVIADFEISNLLSECIKDISLTALTLIETAERNAGDDDKTVIWAEIKALKTQMENEPGPGQGQDKRQAECAI